MPPWIVANPPRTQVARSASAGIEYVNVYTGASAGMATASSSDEFVFKADGSYRSSAKIVMGTGSNLRYGGEKYAGKASVTNWSMTMTNRFNGKTKTFNIAFETVKGGRILHLVRDATVSYALFLVE